MIQCEFERWWLQDLRLFKILHFPPGSGNLYHPHRHQQGLKSYELQVGKVRQSKKTNTQKNSQKHNWDLQHFFSLLLPNQNSKTQHRRPCFSGTQNKPEVYQPQGERPALPFQSRAPVPSGDASLLSRGAQCRTLAPGRVQNLRIILKLQTANVQFFIYGEATSLRFCYLQMHIKYIHTETLCKFH